MLLKVEGVELQFFPVHLHFDNEVQKNLFGHKNNKTLRETLEHRRYKKFKNLCYKEYNSLLDFPLGDFLLKLKNDGDSNYKLFLNKYGDSSYSHFWIDDETVLNKKGLYCYCVDNEVRYIGRCLDSFKKRINQGYGKIHPKNCYIDGQATNCHLNALITTFHNDISLLIYQMEDNDSIINFENELISLYHPKWNLQIKRVIRKEGAKMKNTYNNINNEKNKKFERFWEELIEIFKEKQVIKNWTVDKGYLNKGNFTALWDGSNHLLCDSPGAELIQHVPKKDFKIIYENWNAYTKGNMRRMDLRDLSRFTKYTISILHQYDYLIKK